jgi:hypothetical protein
VAPQPVAHRLTHQLCENCVFVERDLPQLSMHALVEGDRRHEHPLA